MIEVLIPFSKFFWDCDFSALDWDEHRDFIIRHILTDGDWNALRWLRAYIGDDALRDWIIHHAARGLSPRQKRLFVLLRMDPHDIRDCGKPFFHYRDRLRIIVDQDELAS